jgi:hypothetical protein
MLEYMAKRSYLGEFELMILLALIRVGDDAYGLPISKELLNAAGREVALGACTQRWIGSRRKNSSRRPSETPHLRGAEEANGGERARSACGAPIFEDRQTLPR